MASGLHKGATVPPQPKGFPQMARCTFPLPSLLLTVAVLAFASAGACTTLGGGESLDELASGQDEEGDDDGDEDDPNQCGCEELLAECQDDQTDWNGDCDSTNCDADCQEGMTPDGEECQPCQEEGECTPPTEGICEEMYQECVDLCEQPPTDVCDYCDAHLDECLEGSENDDGSDGTADECYAHYEMCQSECVDQDGDDNPPDTGEDCYDQFDECLSECSSDEERAHCEMQLTECLENCGDQ